MSFVNISKLNNPDLPVSNQLTVLDVIPTTNQFNNMILESALMSVIFCIIILGSYKFFKSRLFKRIKILSRFYFKYFVAIITRRPREEVDIETYDALNDLNEQAMWDTALEGLKPLMIALIKKELKARDKKNEDRIQSIEELQQHHNRVIETIASDAQNQISEIRSVGRDAEDNLTDLKRDIEDRCDKIEYQLQHLTNEIGRIAGRVDKLYDITSSHDQKIAENTVHSTGAYIHAREVGKQISSKVSSIENIHKQIAADTQKCLWTLDNVKSEVWNLTQKMDRMEGIPNNMDEDGDEIAMPHNPQDYKISTDDNIKVSDKDVWHALGQFSMGKSIHAETDDGARKDTENPQDMVNEKDEKIMYMYDDDPR